MPEDLKQKVMLYRPHPGFRGPSIPLPKSIKEVIEALDGKSMALEQAIEIITSEADKLGGTVMLREEGKYIGLFYTEKGDYPRIHFWPLIRYK